MKYSIIFLVLIVSIVPSQAEIDIPDPEVSCLGEDGSWSVANCNAVKPTPTVAKTVKTPTQTTPPTETSSTYPNVDDFILEIKLRTINTFIDVYNSGIEMKVGDADITERGRMLKEQIQKPEHYEILSPIWVSKSIKNIENKAKVSPVEIKEPEPIPESTYSYSDSGCGGKPISFWSAISPFMPDGKLKSLEQWTRGLKHWRNRFERRCVQVPMSVRG